MTAIPRDVFVLNVGMEGDGQGTAWAVCQRISEAQPNACVDGRGQRSERIRCDGIGTPSRSRNPKVWRGADFGLPRHAATQGHGAQKRNATPIVRFNKNQENGPEEGAFVVDSTPGSTSVHRRTDASEEAGYARLAEMMFDAMRSRYEQAAVSAGAHSGERTGATGVTRLEPPAFPGALGLVR